MSRQPAGGGDATWKGLLIIAGAVVLGLGVASTIGSPGTGLATSNGVDQPTEKSTTTSKVTSTEQVTTSSSIPLKANKEVKVLVANGTKTSGATKKITDALKPACYTVATPVDALAKVKDEKRPTSTIYSTPGFEREAALLATKLGLQTSANAALPASPPIPTKGVPSYNVLVLMAQDLVDSPPPALPAEDCGTGGSSTTSTVARPPRSRPLAPRPPRPPRRRPRRPRRPRPPRPPRPPPPPRRRPPPPPRRADAAPEALAGAREGSSTRSVSDRTSRSNVPRTGAASTPGGGSSRRA